MKINLWELACLNAIVGASLLAKNAQAPHSFSKHALSLTFFASKLAPTLIAFQIK
jgi:hypothetical protein